MDKRLVNLVGMTKRPGDIWREKGWWGAEPLWRRVQTVAQDDPSRLAIQEYNQSVTYETLWRTARDYAWSMKHHGLASRDIILVQLPNWHEFVVLAVAAELCGAVFAFCPIQWGKHETVRALQLIQPKFWFTTSVPRPGDDRSSTIREVLSELEGQVPMTILIRSPAHEECKSIASWTDKSGGGVVEEWQGASGQDPLEIAVTSGSTGVPKGVLHVHDTVIAAVDSTIQRQGISSNDLIHVALPIGHTFGYFYGVRCALQAGAALLLQYRWNVEEAIELISKHQATVSLGPSAFLVDLMGQEDSVIKRLSSVWLFTLSGDSLPNSVVQKVIARLPFRISRALGMTEFGHALSTDAHMSRDDIVNTLGTPQPGMIFRVTDDEGKTVPVGSEGEIRVKGPFLFAGYLKADGLEENVLDSEGFFRTGDVGSLDERGFLRISGRLTNIIRRGAETIACSLLENVLGSHPDVLHSVVVGKKDPRLGEVPVAFVQMRPGRIVDLSEVLRLFETERVTKKFWPAELRIVENWPVGPTGKVDRKALQDSL